MDKLQKIKEENEITKEILEDFKQIKSKQLQYARDSQKMFTEENESCFYITLVFQNNACAEEFKENFKDFVGFKTKEQVFVDGHALAAKWGKPIKTSFVKKTVKLDKLRDEKHIARVGVYGKWSKSRTVGYNKNKTLQG